MAISPRAANRSKHNKRPLSAFPTSILDGGTTEKRPRSRPKGNGSPVGGIVLIPRKRRSAEIENESRCAEVNIHHGEKHSYDHQPWLSSFHEVCDDG
jgi:hypothetical protein